MATRCPLCRHEFTFGEVLRRWNPFGSPCPHCRKPLAMKRSLQVAILFVSVILPIFWFLGPLPGACALSNEGPEALILGGIKFFAVVLAFAFLAEWIFWKNGWPGYMPARSTDGKAARFWKLFLVVGLPLVLAVAPTVMLFHWSGVFGKNAEQRLLLLPEKAKASQQSKLTLEEARQLVLDRSRSGLQTQVKVCQALRIQSALVLVALAWFLFWSYRLIFHSWTPPVLIGPKPGKDRKRSSKPRRAKRGR